MEKMIIERDVSIPMDDGISLKADIFRPVGTDRAPVIMTSGPYGKGIPYQVGFKMQWESFLKTHPNILPGSSHKLMVWETVDPEFWVPWGYICIRVDSRGAGRSPGRLDIFSPCEIKDYYTAIEWAGTQPWSNGKVGLIGISYYAVSQWAVASLQPPHLAAMIPWEGGADFYRDWTRHGGVFFNGFLQFWYPRQVVSVQHGNPQAIMDPWINEAASGPDVLDTSQLAANRSDPISDVLHRPLDSEWYRSRSTDWSKVITPFLSAANWAASGIHPRGNFEAFTQAASKQKWLECHPGGHEEWFYLDHGMKLQKRFLDYFLKGEDNGWAEQPPVQLNLRRALNDSEFEFRGEQDWPIPRTKWTPIYLSAKTSSMSWEKPEEETGLTFNALGDSITFMSAPLDAEVEITGPLAAKIVASSSTTDMDLFLTFQAFSADGHEVGFKGVLDPNQPLAQGWLRASHRKLCPERSQPYRPYHTHDEIQPLEPEVMYELDVEIWPTNIILPAGFRLALNIGGKDFERAAPAGDVKEGWIPRSAIPKHNHPEDRPESVFGGRTKVYSGGTAASYLLLPIIGPV